MTHSQTNAMISALNDCDDVDRLSAFLYSIVESLPYYNQKAKISECAKYSGERLRKYLVNDSGSVIIAKFRTEVIGFCVSREDDGLIWLSWLAVHASWVGYQTGLNCAFSMDTKYSCPPKT